MDSIPLHSRWPLWDPAQALLGFCGRAQHWADERVKADQKISLGNKSCSREEYFPSFVRRPSLCAATLYRRGDGARGGSGWTAAGISFWKGWSGPGSAQGGLEHPSLEVPKEGWRWHWVLGIGHSLEVFPSWMLLCPWGGQDRLAQALTQRGQLLEVQAGVGLAQQVQPVVQQFAAGDSVEVLQLLHRNFWLDHHHTQDEGRVLHLQNTKQNQNVGDEQNLCVLHPQSSTKNTSPQLTQKIKIL